MNSLTIGGGNCHLALPSDPGAHRVEAPRADGTATELRCQRASGDEKARTPPSVATRHDLHTAADIADGRQDQLEG